MEGAVRESPNRKRPPARPLWVSSPPCWAFSSVVNERTLQITGGLLSVLGALAGILADSNEVRILSVLLFVAAVACFVTALARRRSH